MKLAQATYKPHHFRFEVGFVSYSNIKEQSDISPLCPLPSFPG